MHFITSASHAIMKWYMSLLYSLIFPLDVTTSFTELNRETNKQATFFLSFLFFWDVLLHCLHVWQVQLTYFRITEFC